MGLFDDDDEIIIPAQSAQPARPAIPAQRTGSGAPAAQASAVADAFGADAFDDDDDDLLEAATSSFINPKDFKDRLVLVYPLPQIERDLRGDFGTYHRMRADIIALDGPTDDKWFKRVPIKHERVGLNFAKDGEGWHRDLAHLIGRNMPKVGRMQVQPAKNNPTKDTAFLRAATDADVAQARAFIKAERRRQEENMLVR